MHCFVSVLVLGRSVPTSTIANTSNKRPLNTYTTHSSRSKANEQASDAPFCQSITGLFAVDDVMAYFTSSKQIYADLQQIAITWYKYDF